LSLRPKRGMANLKKGHHGGINYAEIEALGINPDEILDFSVSSNPFPLPPAIKETLRTIAIEQYPDSETTELRQKLSERLGVLPENILAGSGTTELIRLITMTYFRKGDRCLILEPTYGEYEIACRMAGARIIKHRAKEEDGFIPKIDDITALIHEHQPRSTFICNPNNPTGKYFSRREIETIINASGDSLLILDEAYLAFVSKSWNSADLITRDKVITLRSMTKDYGLPGLRLGYAVACRDIIDSLRGVCPPWNVNIIAQKIGVAVLNNEEYLEQSLLQIQEAKQFLTGELSRLGFKVLPSDANYFLVKVDNARSFRNALLRRGCMVRDCSSFGLAEYVRIAPRTMPECHKLVAAIASISPAKGDKAT
jgi:histidinol-phosphate aminotransferase